MAEPQAVLGLYLHLARACDLRQRPLVRDKFLILAGSISSEMNLPSVAHFCRRQILGHNPGHLLRQFPSFRHAGDDERFNLYLASLQRQYPVEKSEMMLESLGIDRARERSTYESDVEYAASLLGTTPEELQRISDESNEPASPGPLAAAAPPPPPPPELDFMSAEPLPEDPTLNQLLLDAVLLEPDLPTSEMQALPDTFAPPPRETEIMELGEDSSYEAPSDPPRPSNMAHLHGGDGLNGSNGLGGASGQNGTGGQNGAGGRPAAAGPSGAGSGASSGSASSLPHSGTPFPTSPGSSINSSSKTPVWLPSRVEGRTPTGDSEDSFFGETLTKHGLARCPDYGLKGDRNSGDRNSDRNAGDRNSGDRNSGDRGGRGGVADRAAWGAVEPAESGPASSLSLNRQLPTGPEAFKPQFEPFDPTDFTPAGGMPALPQVAGGPSKDDPNRPAAGPLPPFPQTGAGAFAPPPAPTFAPPQAVNTPAAAAPLATPDSASPLWNAASIPVGAGSVTARNTGSATLTGEWRLPADPAAERSDWLMSSLMLVGVGGFGFSLIYYLLSVTQR